MAYNAALGEDVDILFQGIENDFVTAVAPPSSRPVGKSPRTHFGGNFDAAQYVAQMPLTIDPTILHQGSSYLNPAEEEISPSLRGCASSHSSNLRSTEPRPGQELLPHGQVRSKPLQ